MTEKGHETMVFFKIIAICLSVYMLLETGVYAASCLRTNSMFDRINHSADEKRAEEVGVHFDSKSYSIEIVEPSEYEKYADILSEIAKEEEDGEVGSVNTIETTIPRRSFSEMAEDLRSAAKNPDTTEISAFFVSNDPDGNVLGAHMLFKPKDKVNLGFKIANGYDVVRKDYRGRGIGAGLRKSVFQYAAKKGDTAYEAVISDANNPSLNNFKKVTKELNLSYTDMTDLFYPGLRNKSMIRSYLIMLKHL